MSDQTTDQATVQTLGPADPNAGKFGKFYAVLAVVLSLAAGAGAFGLITADQVAAIKDLAYQAGVTLGAGVSLVAAFRMRKQLKNGTYEKAPDPVVVTAPPPISLEQVAQVRDQLDTVIAGAVTSAQGGLEQLAGIIPAAAAVTGTITGAVHTVDELVQAVRNRDAASS